MLRKRARSVQKDQHQMGHSNNINSNNNQTQNSDSDSGSGSGSGSESFFNSDGGGGSNCNNKNPKNSSFYNSIPGLLVGLSPKGLALSDCDSVRSPTSPLDFRLFSGLGNPFRTSTKLASSSSSSSCHENGPQRSWGSKLGLISIIDSLDDNGDTKLPGKVLRSSSSSLTSSSSESGKNILFGPMLRLVNKNTATATSSSPKSLPKNYVGFGGSSKPKSPLHKGSAVLFEIGDEPESFEKIRACSLDSCRTISNLSGLRSKNPSLEGNSNYTGVTAQVGSCGNGLVGPLSATEIELSEDYTCVISHGPNPKTTHIFGDCILETHPYELANFGITSSTTTTGTNSETCDVQYPSDDFLSFCFSCNKKLEEGKDIYIYRGEKAFCSLNCRSVEILIDEKLEKSSDKDEEDDCNELFFETGLTATA